MPASRPAAAGAAELRVRLGLAVPFPSGLRMRGLTRTRPGSPSPDSECDPGRSLGRAAAAAAGVHGPAAAHPQAAGNRDVTTTVIAAALTVTPRVAPDPRDSDRFARRRALTLAAD